MKKQIFNPYLPNYEYVPDGEPHVYNNRLFIYGSHDRFNSRTFCPNDYVTWSAPLEDLSDWTFHGIIFKKTQDPLNKEGKYPLFAPDCVKGIDGRYYLYYCPAGNQTIGVAVSEKPEGPFDFLGHVKDKEGNYVGRRVNDPYPFDPAVYIENDKIYLYVGFAPDPSWEFLEKEYPEGKMLAGPYVFELDKDMCTAKSEPEEIIINKVTDPGHVFLEASSLRKINGRYYFIYSSWNSHELCYGLGDNPKGPFEYKGIIHDNGDIGLPGITEENRVSYTGNNHGSLIELNGDWYIFGHRQTNYSVFSRQGIAEKVTVKENGEIDQVEMTSYGLNGKPLKAEGTYGAFIACHLTSAEGAIHYLDNCEGEQYAGLRENHPVLIQKGDDREDNPDQYIKNMKDGATAGFKYFEHKEKIKLTVVTAGAEGFFEVREKLNGELLGIIRLKKSEGYFESEPVEISISEKEKFALYFTYRGKGSIDFKEFIIKSC